MKTSATLRRLLLIGLVLFSQAAVAVHDVAHSTTDVSHCVLCQGHATPVDVPPLPISDARILPAGLVPDLLQPVPHTLPRLRYAGPRAPPV